MQFFLLRSFPNLGQLPSHWGIRGMVIKCHQSMDFQDGMDDFPHPQWNVALAYIFGNCKVMHVARTCRLWGCVRTRTYSMGNIVYYIHDYPRVY